MNWISPVNITESHQHPTEDGKMSLTFKLGD